MTTSARGLGRELLSAAEQVGGGVPIATVKLPCVTAQFRVPEVDVGSMFRPA